jgi:O-antigen/teichoic acid export membrane protein
MRLRTAVRQLPNCTELLWVVFGQAATAICSLVLVKTLTATLTPNEYGRYSLILTVSTLANQVIFGGLVNSVARLYLVAQDHHQLATFRKAATTLFFRSALLVGLIGAALSILFHILPNTHLSHILLVTTLFSITSSFNACLISIQTVVRKRRKAAIYSALDGLLKLTLATAFTEHLAANSFAAIAGLSTGSLAVSMLLAYTLIPEPDNLHNPTSSNDQSRWLSEIWNFALPFSLFGIFTWAQQASDKWALETLCSREDVANYVVLIQLGYTPMTLAINLIMSYYAPIIFRQPVALIDGETRQGWQPLTTAAAICISMTVLSFIAAAMLHDTIFSIFTAPGYQKYSAWMPIAVASGGLFGLGQLLSLKLQADLNTAALSRTKIETSIIGITLNFLSVWFFGAQGAIYGLILYSAIYATITTKACLASKARL